MDKISLILQNNDINYIIFDKNYKICGTSNSWKCKEMDDIFINLSVLKEEMENIGNKQSCTFNLKTREKNISCKLIKIARKKYILTATRGSGVDRSLMHNILNLIQSNLCFIELSLMDDTLDDEIRNNLEISFKSGKEIVKLLKKI